MCFIEHNIMAGAYQFRIGALFTDFRGIRSFPTLQEWRDYLVPLEIVLVKTDTRTWKLETKESAS